MQPTSALRTGGDHPTDSSGDEALARSAATDRDAFEVLYLRHRRDLFRYVRARTPDDETAADIVSATFERALVGIGGYRSTGGGFRAWIFRIARNQVVDGSRRRRTAERHAPTLQRWSTEQAGPDDGVLTAEAIDQLRGLVRRLPDAQREAVLLRYAGGLTTREIAATLGRSEAAVQKLITRTLASLKESFRAIDG